MEAMCEKALWMFGEGYDCSQVVLSEFAPALGLDGKTAKKVAACFGGGMWYGHECGAVTGALMALGLKYGHDAAGDAAQKGVMMEKLAAFREAFLKRYPSCVCMELLGEDLSNPEGMKRIQEKNLLSTLCPGIVADTVEILRDIL